MTRREGFILEEEPLFRWSTMMDVDEEEPLSVIELTLEEKAPARE
jgi:hypothetical protein